MDVPYSSGYDGFLIFRTVLCLKVWYLHFSISALIDFFFQYTNLTDVFPPSRSCRLLSVLSFSKIKNNNQFKVSTWDLRLLQWNDSFLVPYPYKQLQLKCHHKTQPVVKHCKLNQTPNLLSWLTLLWMRSGGFDWWCLTFRGDDGRFRKGFWLKMGFTQQRNGPLVPGRGHALGTRWHL